jgi:hypothetical protein
MQFYDDVSRRFLRQQQGVVITDLDAGKT